MNPHFLFNTLNSLYALSIKGSPDTPEGIMKLSQLMRYMLYESGRGRVYLVKELEAIGYYIHLQRLRMPAHVPIAYEVQGEVGDKLIEPMLLLPLVENVFKHGLTHIAICLEVRDRQLVLRTRNSLRKVPVGGAGGIGLQNLRRRLQLLYAGKHP
jgi:LytS/YehU family sensor histidine kinase